ncbi:hypothetical protein RI367_002743 [Sorochytrium milnesiophthora]
MEDKYLGLLLAVLSACLIGTSFIITKKGLQSANKMNATAAGESYNYLKNRIWWAGMITMVLGEAANFAAYSFAPTILVTPLGALSVIFGAILAVPFLNEKLGKQGIMACTLCLLGSIVIVLHAPEEKQIDSVDDILHYALQPGFIVYVILVLAACGVLIYRIAPVYGKTNMVVYISICSLVGSLMVIAVKAFGIALRLTCSGHNQFVYPSTYFFALVVIGAAITQMNYFNKALDVFSTNHVTPIYYVGFTTATITASLVLFKGFNDSSVVDIISVLCGFMTIFIGVFMLNSAKQSHMDDSNMHLNKQRGYSASAEETHMMARLDNPDAVALRMADDEDDP